MRNIFNYISAEERRSAVIDWAVLVIGILFVIVTVVPALTANANTKTGDTLNHVESVEGQRPS